MLEFTFSTILGIESSCDDTAAAIIRVNKAGDSQTCSSTIFDQQNLHAPFGGVVPEIAARAHVEKIDQCARAVLEQAKLSLDDVDAVAVTAGPGLIGGVLSGVMFAKGLCAASQLPLVGVNHLAGHALSPRITEPIDFPYLTLLISGGHCQFLIVEGYNKFRRLGGTIDDAPGEAFDKTARILQLPQPGGPSIETAAEAGNPERFPLPRPLLFRDDCNMSFSCLKTAVLHFRERLTGRKKELDSTDQRDLAASFQKAVCDIFTVKSKKALTEFLSLEQYEPFFSVVGGVAANKAVRAALKGVANDFGVRFHAPPFDLCTDNAVMIGYAGGLAFLNGQRDGFDLSAKPRWPVDTSQPHLIGSGRKGAKS